MQVKTKVAIVTLILAVIASATLIFMSFNAPGTGYEEVWDDNGLYRIYYCGEPTGLYGNVIKGTPYIPVSMLGTYAVNPCITLDAVNLRLNIDLGAMDIMLADDIVTDFVKTHAGTVYIPLLAADGETYIPLNTTHQFFRIRYIISGLSIDIRPYSEAVSLDYYAPGKVKSIQSGGRINLAWQYVGTVTPEAPPEYDGLDILAPTWFDLIVDGEGNVSNSGDRGYTDMCRERGYMIWATITNNMATKGSTNFTTQTFNTPDLLNRSVAQYIFYSCLYDVDGINIDYEDVAKTDGAGLVNFTKLLRNYTERQGLYLSIDTPIPAPWYSQYDRKSLTEYVDYIAIMTYDEHWSTSPKAGSVSSLPWAEQAIKDTISEGVPENLILMGVPLYTRVWQLNARGKIVSNKAVTMPFIQNLLIENELTPDYLLNERQNYIEYPDGDTITKVWIEDSVSIKNRIDVVAKYNLAGTACWQFPQASSDIWAVFYQNL